jgi:hypothetical protein
MGGTNSKAPHRFPDRWYQPVTTEHAEAIEAKLKAISALKPTEFLAATSRHAHATYNMARVRALEPTEFLHDTSMMCPLSSGFVAFVLKLHCRRSRDGLRALLHASLLWRSAYELNDGWSFTHFTEFATETVRRHGDSLTNAFLHDTCLRCTAMARSTSFRIGSSPSAHAPAACAAVQHVATPEHQVETQCGMVQRTATCCTESTACCNAAHHVATEYNVLQYNAI